MVAIPIGPLFLRWMLQHQDDQERGQCRDVQHVGPFSRGEYIHRIEPDCLAACDLEDLIE